MAENLATYIKGAKDEREWGTWEVIDDPVVDDNGIVTQCEKKIVVYPKQMLSLQVHEGRGEVWKVTEGFLTVIFNEKIITLEKGEEITLPQGTLHAMVNMLDEDVTVYEIQTGNCREADNIRLMDFGGRETTDIDHPHLDAARGNYQALMEKIRAKKPIKTSVPSIPRK